jgi:hypothetical protein
VADPDAFEHAEEMATLQAAKEAIEEGPDLRLGFCLCGVGEP